MNGALGDGISYFHASYRLEVPSELCLHEIRDGMKMIPHLHGSGEVLVYMFKDDYRINLHISRYTPYIDISIEKKLAW